MSKTKTTGFYFKAAPEEMAWIEHRMAQTKISNKSAFLRKMAIDGHVINLDLTELNEIGKLLRVTANNVNQIAKRVNSGGGAYREDVAEVNR
ncbi:MAG: MobC family plasmid mobilization relaxosome protein [Oscillospiraceae bacterium]|nr:MobC family plasmid mobilization relaxosome protein [Oscillospiraceae bacterium]